MSPQERQDALRMVTAQVIESMSEQERIDALREITGQLLNSIPPAQHAAVLAGLTRA
jgi:hypothetical protein